MNALNDLHLAGGAKMGSYNRKTLPAYYHDAETEYRAVRENALLVDYSHLALVSVTGDDAWQLINYWASADISTLRDEQGCYSLVLSPEGLIRGDAYILCCDEGYYLLSENMTSAQIITDLTTLLAGTPALDIQERPQLNVLDSAGWGAIMLEGPYAWEALAEIYGFDIIGLPYHEFMLTDDELRVFRCGQHGEYAYLTFGQQTALAELWQRLLADGEKFQLKAGGLAYQQRVRLENPCWDAALYASWSRNPIALQLQWAIQYDKENFVGKAAVEAFSRNGVDRRLVGLVTLAECRGIAAGAQVLVDGATVGIVINSLYSAARQAWIALALIDEAWACADILGFSVQTAQGYVAAMTQKLPFLYNLSLLVSPTEHSFIDRAKPRHAG